MKRVTNQMTGLMRTFEILTKKFFENIEKVTAACIMRSQIPGKCEPLEEMVCLKDRVLFLGNKMH